VTISRADIKVGARYIIIMFFIYLAWDITRPDYVNQIKSIGEVAIASVYTSVFGVLGWVVKSNWTTTPEGE
jgi:hypothetical protein